MLIWIGSPEVHSTKFLFMDRDGVVNHDSSAYVKHWREFHFYPDALEALRWLHERGIGVVLISNQSALHRGIISPEDFWDLHDRMIQGIGEAGGSLTAALYCPHRPDERCFCRKPAPGMLLAASSIYGISPESAWMIGDRSTDIQAARRAGFRGVLLDRNGPGGESAAASGDPEAVSCHATLSGAVRALF